MLTWTTSAVRAAVRRGGVEPSRQKRQAWLKLKAEPPGTESEAGRRKWRRTAGTPGSRGPLRMRSGSACRRKSPPLASYQDKQMRTTAPGARPASRSSDLLRRVACGAGSRSITGRNRPIEDGALQVAPGGLRAVRGGGRARCLLSSRSHCQAIRCMSMSSYFVQHVLATLISRRHWVTQDRRTCCSFPLLPPSSFTSGTAVPAIPRPPGRRIYLGDIVVSVEHAVEQAAQGRRRPGPAMSGGRRTSRDAVPRDPRDAAHLQLGPRQTGERVAMRALEQRLLGVTR